MEYICPLALPFGKTLLSLLTCLKCIFVFVIAHCSTRILTSKSRGCFVIIYDFFYQLIEIKTMSNAICTWIALSNTSIT